MAMRFQLEYWKDGKWFVGRLPQVPGVFSQGDTMEELEASVREAYRAMREEGQAAITGSVVETKDIEVFV